MLFLKQVSIILLVAMLSLKAMVAPILVLDYEFRKDFIIKNYCINKNRPEMHCDGKCYLAKRLKAAQEKEESKTTNQFLSKLFETECNSIQFTVSVNLFLNAFEYFSEDIFIYTQKPTDNYHSALFHPPKG